MNTREKLIKAGESLSQASKHIKSIEPPYTGLMVMTIDAKLDELIREIKHILTNYGDSDE